MLITIGNEPLGEQGGGVKQQTNPRAIERIEMSHPYRPHWLVGLAFFICTISFAYLMLAGEETFYLGDEPPIEGKWVSPAYDFGWPLVFMIRGPNLDGPSQRWPVGTPQEVVYLSMPRLVMDIGLSLLLTIASCVTVNRWCQRALPRLYLRHYLVFVAWIETSISLLVHAERKRFVSYDPYYQEELNDYPEPVKRLLFDSDTLIDVIPAVVAIVTIGLFWVWFIDLIGRFTSRGRHEGYVQQ